MYCTVVENHTKNATTFSSLGHFIFRRTYKCYLDILGAKIQMFDEMAIFGGIFNTLCE